MEGGCVELDSTALIQMRALHAGKALRSSCQASRLLPCAPDAHAVPAVHGAAMLRVPHQVYFMLTRRGEDKHQPCRLWALCGAGPQVGPRAG